MIDRRHAGRQLLLTPEGGKISLPTQDAAVVVEAVQRRRRAECDAALGAVSDAYAKRVQEIERGATAAARHSVPAAKRSSRAADSTSLSTAVAAAGTASSISTKYGRGAVVATPSEDDTVADALDEARSEYEFECRSILSSFSELDRGRGAHDGGNDDARISITSGFRAVSFFTVRLLDLAPLEKHNVERSSTAVFHFATPIAAEMTLWRVPDEAQSELEEGAVFRVTRVAVADTQVTLDGLYDVPNQGLVGSCPASVAAKVRLSSTKRTAWHTIAAAVPGGAAGAAAALGAALARSQHVTTTISDDVNNAIAAPFSSPQSQKIAAPTLSSTIPSATASNIALDMRVLRVTAAGHMPRCRVLIGLVRPTMYSTAQLVMRSQLALRIVRSLSSIASATDVGIVSAATPISRTAHRARRASVTLRAKTSSNVVPDTSRHPITAASIRPQPPSPLASALVLHESPSVAAPVLLDGEGFASPQPQAPRSGLRNAPRTIHRRKRRYNDASIAPAVPVAAEAADTVGTLHKLTSAAHDIQSTRLLTVTRDGQPAARDLTFSVANKHASAYAACVSATTTCLDCSMGAETTPRAQLLRRLSYGDLRPNGGGVVCDDDASKAPPTVRRVLILPRAETDDSFACRSTNEKVCVTLPDGPAGNNVIDTISGLAFAAVSSMVTQEKPIDERPSSGIAALELQLRRQLLTLPPVVLVPTLIDVAGVVLYVSEARSTAIKGSRIFSGAAAGSRGGAADANVTFREIYIVDESGGVVCVHAGLSNAAFAALTGQPLSYHLPFLRYVLAPNGEVTTAAASPPSTTHVAALVAGAFISLADVLYIPQSLNQLGDDRNCERCVWTDATAVVVKSGRVEHRHFPTADPQTAGTPLRRRRTSSLGLGSAVGGGSSHGWGAHLDSAQPSIAQWMKCRQVPQDVQPTNQRTSEIFSRNAANAVIVAEIPALAMYTVVGDEVDARGLNDAIVAARCTFSTSDDVASLPIKLSIPVLLPVPSTVAYIDTLTQCLMQSFNSDDVAVDGVTNRNASLQHPSLPILQLLPRFDLSRVVTKQSIAAVQPTPSAQVVSSMQWERGRLQPEDRDFLLAEHEHSFLDEWEPPRTPLPSTLHDNTLVLESSTLGSSRATPVHDGTATLVRSAMMLTKPLPWSEVKSSGSAYHVTITPAAPSTVPPVLRTRHYAAISDEHDKVYAAPYSAISASAVLSDTDALLRFPMTYNISVVGPLSATTMHQCSRCNFFSKAQLQTRAARDLCGHTSADRSGVGMRPVLKASMLAAQTQSLPAWHFPLQLNLTLSPECELPRVLSRVDTAARDEADNTTYHRCSACGSAIRAPVQMPPTKAGALLSILLDYSSAVEVDMPLHADGDALLHHDMVKTHQSSPPRLHQNPNEEPFVAEKSVPTSPASSVGRKYVRDKVSICDIAACSDLQQGVLPQRRPNSSPVIDCAMKHPDATSASARCSTAVGALPNHVASVVDKTVALYVSSEHVNQWASAVASLRNLLLLPYIEQAQLATTSPSAVSGASEHVALQTAHTSDDANAYLHDLQPLSPLDAHRVSVLVQLLQHSPPQMPLIVRVLAATLSAAHVVGDDRGSCDVVSIPRALTHRSLALLSRSPALGATCDLHSDRHVIAGLCWRETSPPDIVTVVTDIPAAVQNECSTHFSKQDVPTPDVPVRNSSACSSLASNCECTALNTCRYAACIDNLIVARQSSPGCTVCSVGELTANRLLLPQDKWLSIVEAASAAIAAAAPVVFGTSMAQRLSLQPVKVRRQVSQRSTFAEPLTASAAHRMHGAAFLDRVIHGTR